MEGYPIFGVVLGIISLVSGYPTSRALIPNGFNVPSPCNSSLTWDGVGHLNHAGGGPRNPFGLAFAANGYKWNATLCELDSDGDGRTNGEELGDPECTWTQGSTATQTEGLSHPGVCEPINSPTCSGHNVTCEKPFNCPAITAPGTFNVNIDLPETAVPAKVTTYTCMNFELPHDKEYHIVATTPRIDNINVMHHIIVYECEVDSVGSLNNPLMTPYDCNMASELACKRMIAGWTFGSDGKCFDENAGFLVGGNNGFRYAAYQIHWNNPDSLDSYTDSSGMSFHMTPNLRPYNAGILSVGQTNLVIPPGEERHVGVGSCAPACTQTQLKDSINIVSAVNHMHLLGRAQTTEVLRDGQRIHDLATDERYDYNTPAFHKHAPSIPLRKGDEIKTTCVFNSVGLNHTTYFGQGTNDEMCFAFLTYYPKENLLKSACVQSKRIPPCVYNGGVSNGCDFDKILDQDHPDMVKHYAKVFEKCRVNRCTKDCLDYVRVKKQEPCFIGDHYERTKISLWEIKDDPTLRMSSLEYLLLMDSCDLELASTGAWNQTDSAPSVVPMVPFIILAMGGAILLS